MSYRYCASCDRLLNRISYSGPQWRRGEHKSKCCYCMSDHRSPVPPVRSNETARFNHAHNATFPLSSLLLVRPFAEGQFRFVSKGQYNERYKYGAQCVCKWFKRQRQPNVHSSSSFVVAKYEDRFYDTDVEASQKAIYLINQWNEKNFVEGDHKITVNLPEIWTFEQLPGDHPWSGRKVLVEPFIENYKKFNSNTGWYCNNDIPTHKIMKSQNFMGHKNNNAKRYIPIEDNAKRIIIIPAWSLIMQALSHFSYHISNGQCLVCDLQGGVTPGVGVTLSDPVVMSMGQIYGPTDLGYKGISTFFAFHECNEYCRRHWRRMDDAIPYFSPVPNTFMATEN